MSNNKPVDIRYHDKPGKKFDKERFVRLAKKARESFTDKELEEMISLLRKNKKIVKQNQARETETFQYPDLELLREELEQANQLGSKAIDGIIKGLKTLPGYND